MANHEQQKPHFAMIPFMAQGHMIPMVDIARLLAERGVIVTIITTPQNANRFKNVIDRAIDSGLNIHVFHLRFPCLEVGLPEGCESCDMLPSVHDTKKFFTAIAMLKDQVQEFLQQLKPLPSCLIADICFPWAKDVSKKLNIPRLLFTPTSCFTLLCMHILEISKDFEALTSDLEYFVVPGLPDKIEITKAQYRGSVKKLDSDFTKVWDQMQEAGNEAFGTIGNTFEELEPEYVKEYKKVTDKKVWCLGPISLCNKDEVDKAERGKKALIDENQCLKWLDSQEPTSVIYVCYGSLTRLATSPMIELGLALEASNRPFIWVIGHASGEFKTWLLEEKFEEKTNGRGLLIHGWAPQVLILSHPSVGCFLTHCGWNSILEGITAGLPMITWPAFSDHFMGEKLIVDVIKIGIRVGIEVPIYGVDEENVGILVVKSDEIGKVIDRLMDGGEEGEERRQRARKLGEMAKRATEEGGSSYENLTLLIQDVIDYQENYGHTSAN